MRVRIHCNGVISLEDSGGAANAEEPEDDIEDLLAALLDDEAGEAALDAEAVDAHSGTVLWTDGLDGTTLVEDDVLPQHDRPCSSSSSAVAAVHSRHPASRKWGPFRLTFSPGGTSRSKYGQWQATCFFHALNSRTACTKGVSCTDDTDEAFGHALRLVKTWCLQATCFTRKAEHSAWQPRAHEALPENIADARILDFPPAPTLLVTDADMDGVPDADDGDMGRGRRRKRRRRGYAEALPEHEASVDVPEVEGEPGEVSDAASAMTALSSLSSSQAHLSSSGRLSTGSSSDDSDADSDSD